MTPFTIALIGCGRIAQAYLEALPQVPELNLIAICDVDREAATRAAATYGIPTVCDNAQHLLETVELDAAIICTPPATHGDLAVALLERGIHVLCEKPLAISLLEAQRMAQAARMHNRVLMMAAKFRFVSDVIAAKTIIESGQLGQIALCTLRFCVPVEMGHRWNSERSISGGGVIMDNGPHALDLARFLLGPLSYVQAQRTSSLQNLAVEDTARIHFETESGVLGMAELSWSLTSHDDAYLTISGTAGTVVVSWSAARHYTASSKQWLSFGSGYHKQTAFQQHLRHFAQCVHNPPLARPNQEADMACMQALAAAYRSLQTRRGEKVLP